jgi:23S rRNA pseudouridine2605 synthase
MRLQRFLARSGAAPSRRKAEELISTGRVEVNGSVATIGDSAGPTDAVTLDGEPVQLPTEHVYLALNKPAGYLTSLKDEPGKNRPTVAGLVPELPGLVPVGRLDADTTGLLLFTNDGPLAHRITHPSQEVEKEYVVTVSGSAPASKIDALATGPELDDGPMSPPRLEIVRRHADHTEFSLIIHEGRNRIIRRACAAVGLKVVALHRVRVGPVRLEGVSSGEHRRLTEEELEGVP